MRERLRGLYNRLTNRLLWLALVLLALFCAAAAGAFRLQILHAEDYKEGAAAAKKTAEKLIKTPAPRGEIFDRNGMPLAVNETTYVVKIDPGANVGDITAAFTAFVRLMNRYGEELSDDLPISDTMPRAFLFNGSAAREKAWKRDMGLTEEGKAYDPADFTADETYAHLLNFFKISDALTDAERRQVLALCAARYMERYYLNPFTVAVGVKQETIAAIEENRPDFPNVYVEKDYLRHYPQGEPIAHILGYIRKASEDDLEKWSAFGYNSADIVGKEGVEQAFELSLRGKPGETRVTLDDAGRQAAVERVSEPAKGDDLFLTIDMQLQRKATELLEDKLREILLNKLQGKSAKEKPLTSQDVLSGLIKTRALSVEAALGAGDDSLSYPLREYLDGLKPAEAAEDAEGANPAEAPEDAADDYANLARQALLDGLADGKVTTNRLIAALIDQGVVTATESEADLAKRGRLTALPFLIRKIEAREITPQMANCTPATGSAVVIDLRDGAVLAAANYPNYDNNRFVNKFDNGYFAWLLANPANPWLNRAFQSPMAPGSTFKMITAVAGLENGVISPNSTIFDAVTFTSAGLPYAKCHGSHGNVNVSHALQVSCNYFFYETSYRLGNTKDGTKLEGIEKLNKYMTYFGLNDPTGVEISELYSGRGADFPNISGPGRKEVAARNIADQRGEYPSASDMRWEDGDTIRTAIGQSFNSYTAASMAKYIATLAGGGTRFRLRLMDKLVSADGAATKGTPVVEQIVPVSKETLNAVYTGMRLVVTSGTAASVFKGFEIPVAGKTGTTQESLTGIPDHASFACYAPYDEPLIAMYVVIPNGNTATTLSPAAAVARDIVGWYLGAGTAEAEPEADPEAPPMKEPPTEAEEPPIYSAEYALTR